MTLHLWLVNLAAYSAQMAVIVATGAALPRLLRLRRPDALLVYRQILLAACLVLPWAQPWKLRDAWRAWRPFMPGDVAGLLVALRSAHQVRAERAATRTPRPIGAREQRVPLA